MESAYLPLAINVDLESWQIMEASFENQYQDGILGFGLGIESDPGEQLHPAATVFLNAVLRGLGREINELERENAHFRYLEHLIQQVAVHFWFAAADARPRLIDFAPQQHRTVNMTAQLSRGTTSIIDGHEFLVIPIENAPTVPSADPASFGSISVILAGVAIAAFPSADSSADDANIVEEEDGTITLTLRLSENVSITGEFGTSLVNVEEADAEDTNENEDERLDIIPTFTPFSISIALTPRVRKTLELLRQLSATIDHSMDEDDLRCLTVTALGEDEHKQSMNRYLQLKHENGILAKFCKMILEVYISFPGGFICTALDEGGYDGRDDWYVRFNFDDDEGDRSVAVSDLGLVGLSFSGLQLGINLAQTVNVNVNDRDGFLKLVFTCRLCPSKKFYLGLEVNWNDLTEQERVDIRNEFETNVWNAAMGRISTVPSRFSFKIAYIRCDVSIAGTYLRAVGLLNLELE